MSEDYAQPLHPGSGGSMYTRKAHATREAPMHDQDDQPDTREGQRVSVPSPRHFPVKIAVRVGYGPIALRAEPIEETKETGIILA
jgi:hypothetical protein